MRFLVIIARPSCLHLTRLAVQFIIRRKFTSCISTQSLRELARLYLARASAQSLCGECRLKILARRHGGTGTGNFDLSKIGPQYQNFTTFSVEGGVWNVINTFGQAQTWNVNGGHPRRHRRLGIA
jgi:hypothetical protein